MHLIDRGVNFLAPCPSSGARSRSASRRARVRPAGRARADRHLLRDAATETGVFHESLNFAAVHRLPVVMVCENNLYSVLSGLDVRLPAGGRSPTSRRAAACRASAATATTWSRSRDRRQGGRARP
jgi:pyruvate dehydrogenase E1 component alpha subunit